MVMKFRRRFFVKSEPGLWDLIHSHDSKRGPNMMLRVPLPYLAANRSVGKL